MTKSEPGTWNTLIIGDDRGKMVFTAEQVAEINEQLDKFTTENEVILLQDFHHHFTDSLCKWAVLATNEPVIQGISLIRLKIAKTCPCN